VVSATERLARSVEDKSLEYLIVTVSVAIETLINSGIERYGYKFRGNQGKQ
jgi:hypothetical protein